MNRAIELAKKGLFTTNPNPRVGCVIVKNGEIIGEGFHQKTGEPHAEVYALQQAGLDAKDADAYVTLEPCSHYGKTPPCADALVKAKVKRVFIACLDPNPLVSGKGVMLLEASGIRVYKKVLHKQAHELNVGFFKRMQTGLPWVRIKMAMSLDGRTAMASGESKWITGTTARDDVQKLRARSSAILTGVGTIIADNPSMNVRLDNTLIKKPLLVVLDSKGKLTGLERIFSANKNILIFTKNKNLHDLSNSNCKVEICLDKSSNDRIDLQMVLLDLSKRDVNEVHVECGAKLAGSFINENLTDEIVTYIAPKLMGSSALPLFNFSLDKMSVNKQLRFSKMEVFGEDIKLTSLNQ